MKELYLKIDPKSAVPLYEQLKRGLKLAILSNCLADGERLISIRELAVRLKINPNTIVKVYYQLEVEGFISSRPGAGYFVAVDKEKVQKEKLELFREITSDYISRALDLGYSIDDMVKELKSRTGLPGNINGGGKNGKD